MTWTRSIEARKRGSPQAVVEGEQPLATGEGGGEERSGRRALGRSRSGGAGAAGVESRGGRGGGVGAAQDHSGGGVADGVQARRTEGRSKGAAAYGWGRVGDLAREGGRGHAQCEGNKWSGLAMTHLPLVCHKYVDSNGAPPPGAPLEFCFNY